MIVLDFLIKDIRQLLNSGDDRHLRGEALRSLRVMENVWLGGRGERIVFIGQQGDFEQHCSLAEGATVIDGSRFVVAPGFVDPHTHLPFAGTRQQEFQLKLRGMSYQEIAERGGGIRETVRQTRASERHDLIAVCERRLDQMLLAGTTTAEAKSGYGLDKETEIKQLEVIRDLGAVHPVELVPTFLGAHEIPDEFRGRPRDYLDFLLAEVVPEVSARGLAEFSDIFCEEGYFSVAEAERYLQKTAAAGLKSKVHADEFTANGAAAMAARLNAVSAEHLIAINDEEMALLAASPTAAVLLPGVSFFLRLGRFAPARKLLEQNAIIALGSDFNPGSSMISSSLFILHLGIFLLGLTFEEAFNAVTINAAYAVGREREIGSIAVGKKMDVLLLDIPDWLYLGYHPGSNPVFGVVKSGELVAEDYRLVYKG
jgi:imidazolonepropionase